MYTQHTNADSAHGGPLHTSTNTLNKPHNDANYTHITSTHTDPTRADTPTDRDKQREHTTPSLYSQPHHNPAAEEQQAHPNSAAANHSGGEGAGHTPKTPPSRFWVLGAPAWQGTEGPGYRAFFPCPLFVCPPCVAADDRCHEAGGCSGTPVVALELAQRLL